MSVRIQLLAYQQEFQLSRDFIQTALPGSLLADALETDPMTPEIALTNPIITSDIIQFLVDYAQGKEPTKHNPNLVVGYNYLNIPWMLYYIDPMYDAIDKSDIDTLTNHILSDRAIRENRTLIVGYFIAKGLPVTKSMLDLAIKNGAVDVVKILLPRLPEVNRQHLLGQAVLAGSLPIVDLLLQTPIEITYELPYAVVMLNRTDILDRLLKAVSTQKNIFYEQVSTYFPHAEMLTDLLSLAVEEQKLDIVDYLLEQTDVDPSQDNNYSFVYALEGDNMEIPLRLLASPRFDPNLNLNYILSLATGRSLTPVVEALLQNPNAHLTRPILEAARKQAEDETERERAKGMQSKTAPEFCKCSNKNCSVFPVS
jgi:ankyrin repeat protein